MPFVPWSPTIGNFAPPLTLANGGTGLVAASNLGLIAALGSLGNQTATALAGFTKINGTSNIVSWTAPNDGNQHWAIVIASETVTSNETGGAVSLNLTAPGGGVQTGAGNIFAAAKTTGTYHQIDGAVVEAGTSFTLVQSSALTVGASVVWAAIYAA